MESMSDIIMGLLPRRNAKRWKSTLALKKAHPRLDSRTLYGTLAWMRLRGLIVRRANDETGLFEYARAPKKDVK